MTAPDERRSGYFARLKIVSVLPPVKLTADELKYTNPAASVGGTTNLVWKRVK